MTKFRSLPNALGHTTTRLMGMFCLSSLLACSEATTDSDGNNADSGGDNGGDTGGASGGSSTTPTPSLGSFVPGAAGLRYLTSEQYKNSLFDLLGAEPGASLAVDEVVSGFASIAAARNTIPTTTVEAFETSALSVASKSLQDKTKRSALVACTPKGSSDETCATAFVKSFGRRAWRRPLTDDEAKRYVDVANKAAVALNDFYKGLEYAMAGLLQSPYFLYRSELGKRENAATDGRVRLDGFELATRLSYFVWNSTPDEDLLKAAENGDLDNADGVRKQMERMLKANQANRAPRVFFAEMLRLNSAVPLVHAKEVFPKVSDTLGSAMREETLRTMEDAFSKGQSWPELFTRRDTFVNEELANLYGIKGIKGFDFKATTLPDDGKRMGILGHASFLATHSNPRASSPTKRGVAIRQTFMCDDIPAPPPDVSAIIPENAPNQAQKTLRERLAAHRDNPKCRSCHEVIDPVGLALENFDGLGEYRNTDAGKSIDASGDLDGDRFNDAADLFKILAKRPQVNRCLVNNLFRYALGHIESDGETPALEHLSKMWDDQNHNLKSLFSMLVVHDSFTHVTATPPSGGN
jgi:hypothetical protein